MAISCIIPFYNEDGRIDRILKEVIKINNIDQIIAVDDGSTENRLNHFKKLYPKIKFLRLEKNQGKSAAIAHALKFAKNKIILLLDADLTQFKYREIAKAVTVFQQAGDIDMLILRRIQAPFFIKLLRNDILLSGERILRKTDLLRVLQKGISGYQLESALNEHFYRERVFWFPYSGLNVYKLKKRGLRSGLWQLLTSSLEVLSGAGSRNYFKHVLFFAHKKVMI